MAATPAKRIVSARIDYAGLTLGVNQNGWVPYLINYIRKQLRNGCAPKDADTLLHYPVVYLHFWTDSKRRLCCYIGETNDLSQRTAQHAAQQQSPGWHSDWIQAISTRQNAWSLYFGGPEMNKSMGLDLEDCLVRLLRGRTPGLLVKTQSTQTQYSYSNKTDRDALLREIWDVLRQTLKPMLPLPLFDIACQNVSLTQEDRPSLPGEPAMLVFTPRPDADGKIDPNAICTALREDAERSGAALLLLRRPVVYLHIYFPDEQCPPRCYTGESDDLFERTLQHLRGQERWETQWREAIKAGRACMLAFGHRCFNKSMTLDLEDRLIRYGSYLKVAVNHRFNLQERYDNMEQLLPRLQHITDVLNALYPKHFQTLETMRTNCRFLSFPLYQLTDEQQSAQEKILETVLDAVEAPQQNAAHQVLIVCGKTGSGKTILASSLLFALTERGMRCRLMVNSSELAAQYEAMARLWQLGSAVSKSDPLAGDVTNYISGLKQGLQPPDVLLVDESHLLNAMEYMGGAKPQLKPLVNSARVTVLFFDPAQFVYKMQIQPGKFDSPENTQASFAELLKDVQSVKVLEPVSLTKELRMVCAPETEAWIRALPTVGRKIPPLRGSYSKPNDWVHMVTDQTGYRVCVFEHPQVFQTVMQRLSKQERPSCMLATYDWKYNKKDPEANTIKLPADVDLCWHRTGKSQKAETDAGSIPDPEPWTMHPGEKEVGFYHDIIGFDLNYAGVILGPTVSYQKDTGLRFVPNKHVDMTKDTHDYETLIANELNVLMTRGIKGLYLYACDEKLRDALIEAMKSSTV